MLSFGEEKENIFPIIGTIIGILVNLSPGILFIEIVKQNRIYIEIPLSMLISNLFCNWINLSLGCLLMDYIMIVSSIVGTFLAIVWFIWYLFYFLEFDIKTILVNSFIVVNLSVEFVWICGFILGKDMQYVTRILAIVITVINFATPGQNIIKVIRTAKYKLIPIFTTLSCLLCSGCWFIYGMTLNEYSLYVPNGLGLVFGLLQLTIWTIYYCKTIRYPIGEKPKNISNTYFDLPNNYDDTLTNDYVEEDTKDKIGY